MRHARVSVCLAILAAGCGDPDLEDAWDEEPDADPIGYVVFADEAREAGLFLKVTGYCVTSSPALPREISSTDTAYVIDWAETDSSRAAVLPIDVIPDQVLVVHGPSDSIESLEIAPDRASITAYRPSAVAELATMVYADAITRNIELIPSPGYPHVYGLYGSEVWANLQHVELPEGIASIHPVPVEPRDVPEIPLSELILDPEEIEDDFVELVEDTEGG
jgi:hypothetical protein